MAQDTSLRQPRRRRCCWWPPPALPSLYSIIALVGLASSCPAASAEQGTGGDVPVASSTTLGVKIISPKPGQALSGETVKFVFRVRGPQESLRAARLCFSVVNKRVSYFQSTQCLEDYSQPYTLRGFVPGVWRARAYLVEAGREQDAHWKGGHDDVLGDDDQVRFVVDPDTWRRESYMDYVDRFFADLLQEPPDRSTAEYRAMLEHLPRMEALEIARTMVRDPWLQGELARVALPVNTSGARVVNVLMFNEGHLPLALNALSSLRRVGMAEHTIVFGATPGVCQALVSRAEAGPACMTIPSVSSFCPHCAEVRDVWSTGFPDIAVLKPVCVLAALTLGYDVLWLDTDVVVLQPPLPFFHPRADLSIQAGAAHKTEVPATGEQAFRSELCTGFYLARSSAFTRQAFKHVILEMATHASEDQFGDQSATNLVLFEGRFRGLPYDATVEVLDPLSFPSGGVYFETDEVEMAGGHPVIVHNNFIFGMQAKIQRFKERGLWYDDWEDRPEPAAQEVKQEEQEEEDMSLEQCLRHLVVSLSPENALVLQQATTSPAANYTHGERRRQGRAVATVTLGDRPWVEPLVLPRLKDFAERVGADLFVVKGDSCMADGVPDFRTCAMTEKVSLVGGLLRCYSQVLLADDTALIRRDCPDLFAMVPPHALGACVEDERVRAPRDTRALVRLSCLKYNVVPRDDVWFNSGLVLLSSSLVSPEDIPRPTSTDPLLHGEQGYLNAIRQKQGWPIWDLGYAFNFVGSFEGANAPTRPLENSSLAYIVHATTGLPDSSPAGRSTFLSGVDASWTARGL